MKIDPNAKIANLPETKGGHRGNAARLSAHQAPGADAATLVGNARIQQLEKQVSQLPDSRADRLEALTRAVRGGKYNADPEQIAQALFADMSARSVLVR